MLTQAELRQLAGERVYARGERYAAERRVHGLHISGMTLLGQVVGNEVYETWMHLDGSFGYGCSCPYDGLCKHVVALAITWWEQGAAAREAQAAPDRGRKIEGAPLGAHLALLSAAELSELVQELAAATPGAWPAVVEFLLRRRVARLGQDVGLAEQDAREVRAVLKGIVAGELRPPALENSAVSEVEVDWEYDDEEMPDPEPYQAVERLVDALIGSVEAHGSPESYPFRLLALAGCARDLVEPSMRAMGFRGISQVNRIAARLGVWLTDPDCPGPAAKVALLQLAEAFLRGEASLADRLKPAMAAVAEQPALLPWFLAALEEQGKCWGEPAASRLRGLAGEIYTQSEQLEAAFEAFTQSDASPPVIFNLARAALEAENPRLVVRAARLACDRARGWERQGVRKLAADYMRAAGETQGAEALLLEAFAESPALESAFLVLKRAGDEEERERLAATMLEILADRGDPALRVQLLLLAKRHRAALGELERMEAVDPQLYDTVAMGLSHDDLDSAIVLWSQAVDVLIGQKQRPAYAEAARLLLQMRRAMVRGGREVWWWKYYGDLQMRYSGYKVLRAELEAAGLNRQEE